MNRLMHPRLALKFGLALFVVVAGALGIVYLAVVPRLESRLVDAKIHELETARPTVAKAFESRTPFDYDAVARGVQSTLGVRVVVLQRLNGNTLRNIADSPAPLSTRAETQAGESDAMVRSEERSPFRSARTR